MLRETATFGKSSQTLAALLEERLRPGADVADVDRRIQSLFGETWCVVFTDMVGFSKRSAAEGIIPFLVLIHELDRICVPIVQKNAGFVLKRIADSYMLIFREPASGLRACLEIHQALARENAHRTPDRQLLLGCGIGYGPCLKLGDDDIFGVEVNRSAKLGEDRARAFEILVTESAAEAVGDVPGVRFERHGPEELGFPFLQAHDESLEPAAAKRAPGKTPAAKPATRSPRPARREPRAATPSPRSATPAPRSTTPPAPKSPPPARASRRRARKS